MSNANPPTLRYKFRSAMTKPTVKNTFEAGINGRIRSVRAKTAVTEFDEVVLSFECIFGVLFWLSLNMSIIALRKREAVLVHKLRQDNNLNIV